MDLHPDDDMLDNTDLNLDNNANPQDGNISIGTFERAGTSNEVLQDYFVRREDQHSIDRDNGNRSRNDQNDRDSTNWRNIIKTLRGNNHGGRGRGHNARRPAPRRNYGESSRPKYPLQNQRSERNYLSDFSLRQLEDISEKDSDEIICFLEKQENGFDKMLQNNMSPDKIILVMRIIKKICESVFRENTGKILASICCPEFLNQLKNYIQDINIQDDADKNNNKLFWNLSDLFFECVSVFYETLLTVRPNSACDVLPKLLKVTINTIKEFEKPVDNKIKQKLEYIQIKLDMSQEDRKKKKIAEENSNTGVDEFPQPPDDFRQISLYPTIQEITEENIPFIRPIIDKGCYKNVDDYLDVQFRLLREDFVGPLRKGICTYLANQNVSKGEKREKNHDVHIYYAKIIKSETVNSKVVRVVKLDLKRKNFRIENSRRFMFGSLVCFTKDNFKHVIFGTITERNNDLLKKGLIGVELFDINFEYSVNYLMVECSVYFEPYYQVLKALQTMTTYDFPLKKYIIDVDTRQNLPQYLLDPQKKGIFKNDDREVELPTRADISEWPTAEKLGFDESQLRAFYSALTQEFCVIQGPPGTGKTYLGLRIAEVLLENNEIWQTGPILVVCYTNHALDQFLEGILQFTDQIVRVGGQSRDKNLDRYNISYIRRCEERNYNLSDGIHHKRHTLERMLEKINGLQRKIDLIYSNEYVFDLNEISKNHLTHFKALEWFNEISKNDMVNWLLEGYHEMAYRRINFMNPAENCNDSNSNFDQMEEFYNATNINDKERILDDIDIIIDRNSWRRPERENNILTSIHLYNKEIYKIQQEIYEMEKQIENNPLGMILYDPFYELDCQLEVMQLQKYYIQYRLGQYSNRRWRPYVPNIRDKEILKNLPPKERWDLYLYLINEYRIRTLKQIYDEEERYRQIYREYEEMRVFEDIKIMSKKSVIGMTTTGAARYQTILQAIKSPIVIVEEAAEVLESHVVVSLTSGCQQLILIGDHKQLRPSTSVYELAKHYKLEISLFERMVKNNIHCSTLEVQHRMRPDIAKLIVPLIYPKLENDVSVLNYPHVRGVTKSLFFITHDQLEQVDDDITSKKNIYEARFIISLARHLLLQGYDPSEITILTTYAEQMFYLWKEKREVPSLEDVKITVVDNFQGEENKIILLSLVRSNNEGNIGFLKIDNRVCVALSRAKEGMFIIGNMDCLTKKENRIWPSIRQTLEDQDAIGTYLTLQCQNHPDMFTEVKEPKDFLPVSEGGCTLICGKLLICGHSCKSLCHIVDRDHVEYRCKEPCKNILCEKGHICPDFCYMECKPCEVLKDVTLSCGHKNKIPCHQDPDDFKCPTLVNVKLNCEHYVDKQCYRDIDTVKCPHPCEVRKLCGHQCERTCHIKEDPDHLLYKCYKPCGRYRVGCSTEEHYCNRLCHEPCAPCDSKIKKLRNCGHMFDVPCNFDVNELKCNKPCKKIMECGHKCKMECSMPCGNCQIIVKKTLVECGHQVETKCCEEPKRKNCKGLCPLKLICGHQCQGHCRDECTKKPCKIFIDCKIEPACGHKFKIPCYKKDITDPYDYEILKYCREPCTAKLKCYHNCAGNCGKCAQGKIHMSCQQPCGVKLICGHDCENPCRETCKPCNKKCSYLCIHSRCGKKCGEPCTPCYEPCQRRCRHKRCTKPCGFFCDVESCIEPCSKLLPCQHPCLGFCSDPCPPICRICDPNNEAFDILFGNEENPDSKFVYLVDCKHSIESQAMDLWIQSKYKGEINVKSCPKCNTLITRTQRYSNYIKKVYLDIIDVKKQLFGNKNENDILRKKNLNKVIEIKNGTSQLVELKQLKNIMDRMNNELSNKKGKRQTLSIHDLRTIENQLQIIITIVNIYKKFNKFTSEKSSKEKCVSFANYLLDIIFNQYNRITNQEIQDFQLELNRFEKIVQVCNIEVDYEFKNAITKDEVAVKHIDIWTLLKSIETFNNEKNEIAGKLVQELREMVNKNMSVTPEERKMIVNAMGMKAGHWFKCPNGHTYCITECGGAMEIGKCNECGAEIGGQNHNLLSTNTHDKRMDGSSFPAWSEQANNMRNFIDLIDDN